MLYLLWLLPVLTSLILFIVFRDVLAYKIGAGALLVSIIYSSIHVGVVKSNMTQDTEWWGNYAISVHYYDDWNEEVSCRHPIYCTTYSTDSKGNTTSSTYVCGYEHLYDVDYHSEYWSMRWDNGHEDNISRSQYIYWSTLWKSKLYKIELNRSNVHDNDGDDMAGNWDGRSETSENLITEHEYVNKVQASNSVFKADVVDSTDVAQYHLYEYPVCQVGRQEVILGAIKTDKLTDKLFEHINGYYGSRKQFKLIICLYRDQLEVTAERQYSYWQNLNKNEFLVCLGLDKANQVQWCKTYSWMDKPLLSIEVESWFRSNRSLNLNKFVKWLPENIEKYWQRKHFRDFNYLQIEITQSHYTIIGFIIFLFCIIQTIVTKNIIKES